MVREHRTVLLVPETPDFREIREFQRVPLVPAALAARTPLVRRHCQVYPLLLGYPAVQLVLGSRLLHWVPDRLQLRTGLEFPGFPTDPRDQSVLPDRMALVFPVIQIVPGFH